MQILNKYTDCSLDEKRFLIVNCETVFQDHEEASLNKDFTSLLTVQNAEVIN